VEGLRIRELRPGMEGVSLTARIVEVSEKIEVETRFGRCFLAQAIIEDGTGRAVLNLWRQQIELVKVGDVVRIENAFVRSFKGQLELNVGSRGKIVVVSRS
jgi:replication factor A1